MRSSGLSVVAVTLLLLAVRSTGADEHSHKVGSERAVESSSCRAGCPCSSRVPLLEQGALAGECQYIFWHTACQRGSSMCWPQGDMRHASVPLLVAAALPDGRVVLHSTRSASH